MHSGIVHATVPWLPQVALLTVYISLDDPAAWASMTAAAKQASAFAASRTVETGLIRGTRIVLISLLQMAQASGQKLRSESS